MASSRTTAAGSRKKGRALASAAKGSATSGGGTAEAAAGSANADEVITAGAKSRAVTRSRQGVRRRLFASPSRGIAGDCGFLNERSKEKGGKLL